MKKYFIITGFVLIIYACGSQTQNKESESTPSGDLFNEKGNPTYDPNRGEGKFTTVDLPAEINNQMAEDGKTKVFDIKCSACHKLTDEKLVGPGWKGVTSRNTPVWIMNFITNTDDMLTKDPKAQAQLEICLVRMPNQNLSDEDARNVLEFMRKNDAGK
ncbi:MAG TPA: cytochrome c [Chitinophagaceae bacterium]|nr:cytochrome c [Chitinophagaceae bacterium]